MKHTSNFCEVCTQLTSALLPLETWYQIINENTGVDYKEKTTKKQTNKNRPRKRPGCLHQHVPCLLSGRFCVFILPGLYSLNPLHYVAVRQRDQCRRHENIIKLPYSGSRCCCLIQTSAVELLRIGLFLEIFGKTYFLFLPLLFYIYSNSDNS